MVHDNSSTRQIVVRRSNSTGDKSFTMKERDETLKEIEVKENLAARENLKEETEVQAGLFSKISGGVYNKAASVVGGVGWVAGTALSTTFTAVSAVGGVALTPFRKSPKDKSD